MSSVGATNVGNRAKTVETSPEFDGFSKVRINVTEDLMYEAGTDTGRLLELTNPWGTQQMAEDVLAKIRGHQYQPYTATGALLDPAVELGDGITVAGVYSGVYGQDITFSHLYSADVEAPQDEEIDHEFPYETVTDRQVIRQFANVRSQFTVQAGEIAARVTREGGDNASFGWSLTEDGFVLSSGNRVVFQADEDGITVTGRITATSGYIGTESQGFEITSNAIRNGVLSMSDTAHYGIYIGTDGINLGKGTFKVDSSGNLTATSGRFTGTVYAGSIQYGGAAGTFSGYGLTSGTVTGGYGGAIGGSTITTANTNYGINTSLGYADYSNSAFNGWVTVPRLVISNGGFTYAGNRITLSTYDFPTGTGSRVTIRCLGWA